MAKIIYYDDLEYEDLPTSKSDKCNKYGLAQRVEVMHQIDFSRKGMREDIDHFIMEFDHFGTSGDLGTEVSLTKAQSNAGAGGMGEEVCERQVGNDNGSNVNKIIEPTNGKGFLAENKPTGKRKGQYHGLDGPEKRKLVNSKITSFYQRCTQSHCEGADRAHSSQSLGGSANIEANYSRQYLETILADRFKFQSFRTNQIEAIWASLAGFDTLILMPTGSGKSICYQLPALISKGITIVISPLLALIADQKKRLTDLGLESRSLAGDCKSSERDEILLELTRKDCRIRVVFLTPEGLLMSPRIQTCLKQMHEMSRLARFVIDEAHCVSTWGTSFRKDYSRLGYLKANFKRVPIMAMTATATPKVRQDILSILELDPGSLKEFNQSYNRTNILFGIREKSKECKSLICGIIRTEFLNDIGIVYCLTRKECETLAEEMSRLGLKAVAYHGGLKAADRTKAYESWLNGSCNIVVATIAFGMGIDKNNVRYVFHFVLPRSIDNYYQEAGRAGRDSNTAYSIIFYSRKDVPRMKAMISGNSITSQAIKEKELENLEQMIGYAEEIYRCRRTMILEHLGENFNRNSCATSVHACDNCLVRCQAEERISEKKLEDRDMDDIRSHRERAWRKFDGLQRIKPH